MQSTEAQVHCHVCRSNDEATATCTTTTTTKRSAPALRLPRQERQAHCACVTKTSSPLTEVDEQLQYLMRILSEYSITPLQTTRRRARGEENLPLRRLPRQLPYRQRQRNLHTIDHLMQSRTCGARRTSSQTSCGAATKAFEPLACEECGSSPEDNHQRSGVVKRCAAHTRRRARTDLDEEHANAAKQQIAKRTISQMLLLLHSSHSMDGNDCSPSISEALCTFSTNHATVL